MMVLILCHGNLNRSPAAEVILRRLRPELEVVSAGLKTRGGLRVAKKMRDALRRAGYGEPETRSRPATRELVDRADVVLYMDDGNLRRLLEQFGESSAKKYHCLADLIDESRIPDPHFDKTGEEHDRVVVMLERALARIDLIMPQKGRRK